MEQEFSYFRNFGEQVEQRLHKLDNFAQRNQAPYPARITRNHTTAEAIKMYEEAEAALTEDSEEKPQLPVEVAGRLVAVRIMGKSAFAHLEDGTGRLQIYLRKNDLGPELYDTFKKILTWAIL